MIGSFLAKTGATILWSFLTEKVIIRVVIELVDYLVKSTSNELDDKIWAPAKEQLEKNS